MLGRVRGKGQVGGRHVVWRRGAFSRPRLAVSGAGKPYAKADTTDATRANVGAKGANGGPNPWDLKRKNRLAETGRRAAAPA